MVRSERAGLSFSQRRPVMRFLCSGLLIGLVAVFGCKRESEKGGPGAGTTTQRASQDNRGAEESSQDTFAVEVPRGTKVQQGQRKEINITLDVGKQFKQDVKISFKAPKGIKMV